MVKKKVTQVPLAERREMVDKENQQVSIHRQCDLLQIHRSGLYYKPVSVSEEELGMMTAIDKFHLKDPTLGTRRLPQMLKTLGYKISRGKARRLMRKMRIRTVYCRPRTTVTNPGKYKYPYLLNHLKIDKPNKAWAIDITFIPMRKGFMYMVAIIDLYSRYIVNWSISNSMEAQWVKHVVDQAITMYGKPKIINSDQGSQFTSDTYINLLKGHNIDISMDGKGRVLDNVFIERFWRTIKYDKIYLCPPTYGLELYTMAKDFIAYYNQERPHESLGYQSPINFYHAAA
ncbi:MAG TPA: IS3 family transposase [Saprospiraceae bacterium]|nr:IS3 family transposase [Saprospiraceae bacterium]